MTGQEVMSRQDDDQDTAMVDVPRRRRRRLLPWIAALAVAGGAGSAGVWWWPGPSLRGTAETANVETGPAATADVTRETLTRTESWSGTLGHGTPLTIRAKDTGTVTRLPKPDSAVARGTELYRVDEQPVIAMIGRIPLYRELSPGAEGADVKAFEWNLAKLGYDGFDVDDEYTDNTAEAVEEWQEDIGAEETGTVGPDDVVMLPRKGRVNSVAVALGDTLTAGTAVLSVTASEQIVSLEVDVTDRDLLAVKTPVTVRLPGGGEVAGTVSSTQVVADTSDDSNDGEQGGQGEDPGADDTIAEVEVALAEPVEESLLGSPVDVVVAVETREDVLVVPVTALLALAEGGFGLEVVQADGSTKVVAVETGLFANGKVEVSGRGVAEGTVVGVAGR